MDALEQNRKIEEPQSSNNRLGPSPEEREGKALTQWHEDMKKCWH